MWHVKVENGSITSVRARPLTITGILAETVKIQKKNIHRKKYSFRHFNETCLLLNMKNMVTMVVTAENWMKVIFDLSWVHCVWWRSVLESQQWGYFAVVIIFSCPRKWHVSEKNQRRLIWHHELSWTGVTRKTIHIRFLFENIEPFGTCNKKTGHM